MKLLRLRSQLEKLNCLAHSAPTLLTGEFKNTFKRLHFRVKFLSDLAGGGAEVPFTQRWAAQVIEVSPHAHAQLLRKSCAASVSASPKK